MSRTSRRRTRLVAALGSVVVASALIWTLGGCAADVPMDPAKNANDPACASVIVRLPEAIGELAKRTTNAQATGAWGDPVAIELTCGIEPSGPTTDECVSVDGIDWIIDDSRKPLYRFEAYGRNPGLQLVVDSERVSGTEAVQALGSIVSELPQERACTALSDTLEFDE